MAAFGRPLLGAAVAAAALWGGVVPALLLLVGAAAVQRATALRGVPAPRPAPAVAPDGPRAGGVADARVVDVWAALRRVATSVGWALAAWGATLLLLALDARASGPSGADSPAWAAGTFVALLLPGVLLGGLVHGVRAARRAHGTTAASPAGR